MKKVGAIVVVVLVSMVLFSQTAKAGTSLSVGISTPGMYFEASSMQPSPHHVWVAGRHESYGHHRHWVPGHWRHAPVVRTAYVPAHHYGYRDSGHRYDRGGYRHDGAYRDDRNSRNEWNGHKSDRNGRNDRDDRNGNRDRN